MSERDEMIRALEAAGVLPEEERGFGQVVAPDVADALLAAGYRRVEED